MGLKSTGLLHMLDSWINVTNEVALIGRRVLSLYFPQVPTSAPTQGGCWWSTLGPFLAPLLSRKKKKKGKSVTQSCLTLCDPMDCSLQGPLSMEFSRQEYWSAYTVDMHTCIHTHMCTQDICFLKSTESCLNDWLKLEFRLVVLMPMSFLVDHE